MSDYLGLAIVGSIGTLASMRSFAASSRTADVSSSTNVCNSCLEHEHTVQKVSSRLTTLSPLGEMSKYQISLMYAIIALDWTHDSVRF
jgi:hypothetical protein